MGKMLKVFTMNCHVARDGAPKAVIRDAIINQATALSAILSGQEVSEAKIVYAMKICRCSRSRAAQPSENMSSLRHCWIAPRIKQLRPRTYLDSIIRASQEQNAITVAKVD